MSTSSHDTTSGTCHVLMHVLVFEDATGGRHRDILVAPETPGGATGSLLDPKVYVAIFVARRSPITVSIASRSRSVIANIAKWPHLLSMTRSSLSGIMACSSS